MTQIPFPTMLVQVQKPMNPTAKDEFRSDVVAMPNSDIRQPIVGGFRDAVLAANKAVLQSRGAAWGVAELDPGKWDLVKLGVRRNGGYSTLEFDNFGPDKPIGGPYTDRFEKTATAGVNIVAVVGMSQFAGLKRGFSGEVLSLTELGFKAGTDFPID